MTRPVGQHADQHQVAYDLRRDAFRDGGHLLAQLHGTGVELSERGEYELADGRIRQVRIAVLHQDVAV